MNGLKIAMKVILLTAVTGACLFSTAAAGDLNVYTALEDDELAVYLPAFKKAHPDINVNLSGFNGYCDCQAAG
jgi:ABC-type glycerol-3-phosphate transport system substrate-binding protein